MGIHYKGGLLHWNYFLALESDLDHVSRFVEFSEPNFSVYSIELAHLLLATCSEIDVVLKALCQFKNKKRKHWVIDNYQETVEKHFQQLVNEQVHIPRYGLRLTPFENWTASRNPIWWRSHNKVKHQRNDHYHEANLKNVLNSVAALALVTLYYYRETERQQQPDIEMKRVTQKLLPEAILVKFDDGYYIEHVYE